VIHAIDRDPRPGQRTITAICGARVSVNVVLSVFNWDFASIKCVGCRAMFAERVAEYAALPSRAAEVQ